MKSTQEKPQLYMIWPPDKLTEFIESSTQSSYIIRTYQAGDETQFLSLMAKTDFDPWDDEKLKFNMSKIIPGGWFFAVETATEKIVATAMCIHNYGGTTPFTGDVGWLACDRTHRGNGLGYALIAHVTNRFLRAGYSQIQLHTEYHRLAAIKIYLQQGYLPVMYSARMHPMWREVCDQIGWKFTPDTWLRNEEAYQDVAAEPSRGTK